jgi:hypothetical protein
MRLPLIRHLVEFTLKNDDDYLIETLDVLEDLIDARGIKDEELDVIGEIMSAQNVRESIMRGLKRTDALNKFMQRVTSVGK